MKLKLGFALRVGSSVAFLVVASHNAPAQGKGDDCP